MFGGTIDVIIVILVLGSMGLLGLAATGGLPGGSAQAQRAASGAAARLAPYAGIIGLVGLILGILELINLLTIFGILMAYRPIYGILWLLEDAVLILLGLLLAYPLIAQATGGGSAGAANAIDKVKAYQRPLSLAALALAALLLVFWVLSIAHVYV